MRVLMVSHTGNPSGSNDVAMAMLENVPAGTDVKMVFLTDGPLVAEVAAMGIQSNVIETGRARELHRQPRTLAKLRTLARDVDIVFSHVAKAQALAGLAARAAGTESIWLQHELPGTPRLLQRASAASRPKLVIANSDFVASRHRQLWPRANVEVVHPGVRAPNESECHIHVDSGSSTVAVLSRLDRWKRIELAIDSFAAAQSKDPSLRLLVIGGQTADKRNAGYKRELTERASEKALPGSIEFLGEVPNAKTLLAEVDILLQLSEHEPFGLSVAEALSYRVPSVVSKDGGMTEIIEHGKSGFAVAGTNIDEVANQLLTLSRDAGLRNKFGAAGRERAASHFDRDTQSRQYWLRVGAIS